MLWRNGAGKSTTLKAIMGLVRPRSGSIRLDGLELTRLPAHEYRRVGRLARVRAQEGNSPSVARNGWRPLYALAFGQSDGAPASYRHSPQVPPVYIALVGIEYDVRAVGRNRYVFDLARAGGERPSLTSFHRYRVKVKPAVALPREYQHVASAPE